MIAIVLMAAVLPPCPATPNCVSTSATDREHAIAPIAFSGDAGDAMNRLVSLLESMPRTRISSKTTTTLRVQFRTLILRFVDDAVFVVDDTTKSIQFRSASRVGRSDLGVNRRRMEAIRKLLAAR